MERLATVTRAGLATLQDGGRHGYADVGVPVAGAFHRGRYLRATAVVRGEPDPSCPAVEILHGDLAIRTHTRVVACVCGPATCQVDGRRAAVGSAVELPSGAELSVRHDGPGPAYLVVSGWQAPLTLGSAATDTFSRLGGAVVTRGFDLYGDAAAVPEAGVFHRPLPEEAGPLRVLAAGGDGLASFAGQAWQVRDVARSGIRLAGGRLPSSGSVPSAPMVVGAIQVTPSGEAIILGPDGGLTGGYPVVGVVATVDLDRLSLLRPGDQVRFRVVDVVDAAQARAAQVAQLRRSVTRPHLLG